MDTERLDYFARKVVEGFRKGKLTNKAMGITPSENTTLYRMQPGKKDSPWLFICELCTQRVNHFRQKYEGHEYLSLLLKMALKNQIEAENDKIIKHDLKVTMSRLKELGITTEDVGEITDSIFFCSIIGNLRMVSRLSKQDEEFTFHMDLAKDIKLTLELFINDKFNKNILLDE